MEHESQPTFTIERMQPEDVEPATRMRLRSWLDTYTNDELGVTREWIEARNQEQLRPERVQGRIDRLVSSGMVAYVARSSDGEIIGSTTPYVDEDGAQHVGSLYVDKGYHGKGVGHQLMQKVIEWSDPTKPLELGVVTYNERAKAFYRKWQFEEVPGSETLFDNKIPEIKMIRNGDAMSVEHDKSSWQEEVFARGKLFELIHETQTDGRVFEIARRAPGVRLIIANKVDKKILLTKEFRKELNDWDYRLPGGKVFDSLDEYEAFRSTGADVMTAARKKAFEESVEEAGIEIGELESFKKSTLGATVEWDLFVFEATTWRTAQDGQRLEAGENIETDNWFDYDEVAEKILRGEMQEERIALLLLQWISKQKGETV